MSCLAASPAWTAEVTAAVAANFAPAIERIKPEFETTTGHTLVASLAASGQLYSQIRNGAPFDVFLSADQVTAEKLEKEKLAEAGTRFTYAVGRLVLWSARAGVVKEGGDVLRSGDFEHLAVANPKTAPYGAAAEEVMRKLGVWERIEPRLVRGESIAQAFQFVVSGNAELGFVALSQVRALPADQKGSDWIVPDGLHSPLRQDAVLLERGTGNQAARAFLEYLRSAPARAVIEALGYSASP